MSNVILSQPLNEEMEISNEIFDNACEILKCAFKRKSSEDLISFLTNGDEYKDFKAIMLDKLIQLQNKKKLIEMQNTIIQDYGHKYDSFVLGDSIDKTGLAYCITMICIHGWLMNKISTNDVLDRLVLLLKHLKLEEKKIYRLLNNILAESELPFRFGGEYSNFFIYYPPASFEDLEENLKDKDWEYLFTKTEGLHFRNKIIVVNMPDNKTHKYSSKEFITLINLIRSSKRDPNLDNPSNLDIIKTAVLEMLWRNQAIITLLFFELHGSMRLRYARECERISSSVYTQYSQYKAQVMFNNASDEQRTRLTHTHNVAYIGKTVAKQLGCNWELTEAIGLGHDLGHVPFGHQGEEALDECLHKSWAGRFAHSLQSAKVLGQLSNQETILNKFGVTGLCLSRPVLEGVLKHDTDNFLHDIRRASWRLQYDGWREALLRKEMISVPYKDSKGEKTKADSDQNMKSVITEREWENGLAIGGLETQIVYWADKIAYAGHDWDEFARSGMIETITTEIEQILKRMHQLRHMAHSRDGIIREEVTNIKCEIDIIRYIRYHLEQIREQIVAPSPATKDNTETTGARIYKSLKPSCEVTTLRFRENNKNKEYDSIYSCHETNSVKMITNTTLDKCDNVSIKMKFSPLARFVFGYSYVISEIINKPNDRDWVLKYFTNEEYAMLYDFFKVAHDIIYLTGIYPKPYKKNDDVIWVLSHYLSEIDNRAMVRALQSHLITYSRININRQIYSIAGNFDEQKVLSLGRYSMDDRIKERSDINKKKYEHFKSVTTLNEATKAMGSIGFFEDKESSKKSGKKNLKKWFKENLQKKMIIRLSDDIIDAHSNIGRYFADYYIDSERVRIMKHKAHKIIREVFFFFMKREDMLPTTYKHRIEFDAQRLFVMNYSEINSDDLKDRLVTKYLYERLEEAIKQKVERYDNDIGISPAKFEDITIESIGQFCANLTVCSGEEKKLLEQLYGMNLEESGKSIYYRQEDFYKLCKHIAKARVIADYIATMTDRYAEKKYNEIVSSSTAWSTSFHE